MEQRIDHLEKELSDLNQLFGEYINKLNTSVEHLAQHEDLCIAPNLAKSTFNDQQWLTSKLKQLEREVKAILSTLLKHKECINKLVKYHNG